MKNWKTIPLGEVCKLKNGFAFKSDNYLAKGIPVIRISDIKDGLIVPRNTVHVSENSIYDSFIINENEIIVAMSGATTGKFGIYKSKDKAYQNQRVGKFDIIDKTLLDNNFLLHQLHSLKRQIEKDAYGGAQPNISSKKIEEMEIVLPPLETQQAIVSKIEELFSELDKGIEDLKTAQQQLKTYRQSVLKWAFEGKLTNENVKDGKLPKGWETHTLVELVDKISDGPFGSNLKSIDYVKVGVRVIRLENIGVLEFRNENKSYVTEEKYETIKRHTVTKGDIIFSSFIIDNIRTVILPDYIDKAINKADCFLVRCLDSKINRRYLCYYFSTKAMKNQLKESIHGATRPRINTTQLKLTKIPYCSIKEQHQIVQEIESRLSVADKMEESIVQSLQQAEALRQSILKKAFSRELV